MGKEDKLGVVAAVVIATAEQLKEVVLNEELTREEVLASVEGYVSSIEAQIQEQSALIVELQKAPVAPASLKKVDKKGLVRVKIVHPVTGKFLLPYNVGQVVSLDEKQADELVEARYAEYVG